MPYTAHGIGAGASVCKELALQTLAELPMAVGSCPLHCSLNLMFKPKCVFSTIKGV